MNVLYFLEPNIELENKLFRLGTVRNHLDNEIENLSLSKDVNVKVLLSDSVYNNAKEEGLLKSAEAIVVSQDKVKEKLGDSSVLYGSYVDGSCSFQKEESFYREILKEFEPDVIVCYECLAPYFSNIFPNVIILNNTLGMLSRAPYPEMSVIDPVGIYGNSFISENIDCIRKYKASDSERIIVNKFKSKLINKVSSNKHNFKDKFTQFDTYILLPLQVSGYFAFDSYCDFKSQLDFVENVMEKTPSNVGIIVTTHGVESSVFECDKGIDILKKHSNLIYDVEINSLRWSSQHVLPYCHGVISVSSSVAMTAMLWELPVYSPSNSHLKVISQNSIEKFYKLCLEKKKIKYDGILEFLILHYNVTTHELHTTNYLFRFILRCLEYKNRSKEIDLEFYIGLQNSNDFGIYSELRFSSLGIENEKYSPSKYMDYSTPLDIFEDIFNKIDVVTFDVFDTLISRNLYTPNSLFDLMELESKNIFSSDNVDLDLFGGFRNLRERAANRVIRKNKKNKKYEITLVEIYNELRKLTGISKDSELLLRKLEIRKELQVTTKRKYGKLIFELAKKLDKRVILISDMYLSKGDIDLLLRKNGYDLDDVNIYVSSEFGITKKHGGLFDIVKNDIGQDLSVVHIGDNYISDYVRPRKHGLWAVHIPCANLNFESSSYAKINLNNKLLNQNLGSNIHYGLVSRKFYDSKVISDSYFESNPYMLGYVSGGSIMLGFASWIKEKVKEGEYDKVYFLARDGYLIKSVYDKLRENDSSLPESEYLLASRRCYSTASFKCENDIISSVSLSFSKNTISFIMKKRYNIDHVSDEVCQKAGFSNNASVVDIKRGSQKRKFLKLLTLLKDDILHNSKLEREALTLYLSNKGVLDKSKRKCVIDIGHNASLQKYLCDLSGDTISGLYFVTFSNAKSVSLRGFPVHGYLADFEDQNISSHPYVKNIGMFEFLFLPNIPSFERFEVNNGNLLEYFVEGNENLRFSIIKEVHRGVLDYVDDVINITGSNIEQFSLSKNHCVKSYIDFVTKPFLKDASIFEGVSFVDGFGGNDKRYIICPRECINDSGYISNSWWREGAYACINGDDILDSQVTSIINHKKYTFAHPPKNFNKNKIKKKIIKLMTKPHIVVKNRYRKYFQTAV